MRKIYIIVPVYNMYQYLEEAVNSVVNQSFDNLQLIIVDDGSTDSTPELCDRLSIQYKNVLSIHQSNGGVSVARNTGIEYVLSHEKGDFSDSYIGFLDADDFYINERCFEQAKNDKADIIVFSSCRCNNKGNRFNIYHQFPDEVKNWGKGNPDWIINGTPCSFFVSADLISKYNLRFMEDVRVSEDIIYLRKATFCANTIITKSTILYAYRYNSFSAVHTQDRMSIEKMNDTAKAWNDAKKWVDSIDSFSTEDKKLWYSLCEQYAGKILLENIALLARSGIPSRVLSKVLEENPYYHQVLSLKEEWLAEWQKKDLQLLITDIEQFVHYNVQIGKKERIRNVFSKNKIFRYYKDIHNYNLKRVI